MKRGVVRENVRAGRGGGGGWLHGIERMHGMRERMTDCSVQNKDIMRGMSERLCWGGKQQLAKQAGAKNIQLYPRVIIVCVCVWSSSSV